MFNRYLQRILKKYEVKVPEFVKCILLINNFYLLKYIAK